MDVSDVPYHGTGFVTKDRCTPKNLRLVSCCLSFLVLGLMCVVIVLLVNVFEKSNNNNNDSSTALPSPSSLYSFRVISYNDVYEISPSSASASASSTSKDALTYGGVVYVGSYVKRVREVNPKTLVLLAGDFLGPSLMSQFFNGSQTVTAQNSIGVDYVCLGNHEFDFGREELSKRIAESTFEWLNVNVYESDNITLLHNTRMSVIRDFGFVKVGLFGVMYSPPYLSPSVAVVRDPFAAARKEIATLRAHGANFVIALAHLPYPDLCRLSLIDGVDLVVGGHDHLMQAGRNCGGCPIVVATTNCQDIWDVTVDYQRPNGTVLNTSIHAPALSLNNVAITNILPPDPVVATAISGYERSLNAKLKTVVGVTLEPLDFTAAAVRQRENAFADFILDYQRTRWQMVSTIVDVALTLGGSFRGNIRYEKGNILLGDVLTIYPFVNHITVFEVSGRELRLALEEMFVMGEFPQVSGITYSVNLFSSPHVMNVSWWGEHSRFSAGSEITDNEQVVVATTGFVFSLVSSWVSIGGNSSRVILSVDEGPVETDLVLSALELSSPISPRIDGRIVLL